MIERLTSPPCWLWWCSFKKKWIPTVTPDAWGEKWGKGWEIKLTSRGMFTWEKYSKKSTHSSTFVSLVRPGSSACVHCGRQLNMHYWNERRKKEVQGKANNWIWLSQNVSVCSAMRLCLHSWSVCPGSSLQGVGFGTAGHSYTEQVRWRTLNASPSLSLLEKALAKLTEDKNFILDKTFLFCPIANMGQSYRFLSDGTQFVSSIILSSAAAFPKEGL